MSRKPAIIQFKDGTRAYLYARGWKCKADSDMADYLNLLFPYPVPDYPGYLPDPFGMQVQKAAERFDAEVIQLPVRHEPYVEGRVY